MSDFLSLHELYSLLGSSVHGIFQARILEWVVISSSRDLPDPGIEPESSVSPVLQVNSLPTEPLGKLLCPLIFVNKWESKKNLGQY